MKEHKAQVLIVGAGVGGVAAALSALRLGAQVILTEESPWIGGQLTSQAVPPDESLWVEEYGSSESYQQFRAGVRHFYRCHPDLTPQARAEPFLNPGAGNVGKLCHEPQMALQVLQGMLAPYLASRQLRLWLNTVPVAVEQSGSKITQVIFEHGSELHGVQAQFYLEATELGELLELTGIPSVLGSESQAQTGEMHALAQAEPLNQQAFTWCFAMDYRPGEDHTIVQPANYQYWREYQADFWTGKLLSWTYPHPITGQAIYRDLFSDPSAQAHKGDFWHYRRIVAAQHYQQGVGDVTLVNWPQNDYWLGPLVGVSAQERSRHLAASRELSLSLLYWMQTEAPRHDQGQGYPGLRLRGDLTGTELSHGLALRPYIREARRIQATFTVTETMIGVEARGKQQGAQQFEDSVGIGQYRIDLHPSSGGYGYVDVASWPFQIPLGALLPRDLNNLIAAGKCLGVTHVTNGCYRLHPVEWSVGEAAGALAAFCLQRGCGPQEARGRHLGEFQQLLSQKLGVALAWPTEMRLTPSPGF